VLSEQNFFFIAVNLAREVARRLIGLQTVLKPALVSHKDNLRHRSRDKSICRKRIA
jgi:hypothetical protein